MIHKYIIERNEKGAKEAAEEILHGGLSRAMHEKVVAEQANTCKKNSKAVDFFLRRRERCDKYVRESVAPKRKTEEEILAEKEAELKAEFEKKRAKEGKLQVEKIEPPSMVTAEYKLPQMQVNCMNNGRSAVPFGSGTESSFQHVDFGSKELDAMTNSVFSQYSHGQSLSGASAFSYSTQKSYKPVGFMNFKPKNINWLENGQHKGIEQQPGNSILTNIKNRQTEADAEFTEQQRIKNSKSGASTSMMNGVSSIGFSKVTLPDNFGKWRPSNDHWKPNCDTRGFFKAVGKAYQDDCFANALQARN